VATTDNVEPADPTSWTLSTSAYVGKTADGSLTVDGGSDIDAGYASLGYDSGVTGTATVDGGGSSWTCNNYLHVGYRGGGTLHITNGAYVDSSEAHVGRESGSTGEVTIDGAFSTLDTDGRMLHVGGYGAGTLNITNGGTLHSDIGKIAQSSGSTGAVTVDGAGSRWTNEGTYGWVSVGWRGNGTLDITNGADVSNTGGTIGGESLGTNVGTGVVTVDGAGSTWTCDGILTLGYYDGNGTLNITNGGAVSVTGKETWVARGAGATGLIHLDGGTLTTDGLFCDPDDLTGTGTITTYGLVSDLDLVFDASHGLSQTILLNGSPDRNITLNLGVTGTAPMGAGFSGTGTMHIADGLIVESTTGHAGYKAGSSGTVTVDGCGSRWITKGGGIYVGYYGSGTLSITHGGGVCNSGGASIGCESGATGEVTVDGDDSSWQVEDSLSVGDDGSSGILNITNGGAVSNSHQAYIGLGGGTGTVTVDGAGSTWTNNAELSVASYDGSSGTVNITNGGSVLNYRTHVGYSTNSTGEVTVDGAGSTWTVGILGHTANLDIGRYNGGSSGTLKISDGGSVTVTRDVRVHVTSGELHIEVSNNDMFTVARNFTNDGMVRLTAQPGLAPGNYTPISVGGSWLGSGTYEAFGGVWVDAAHTFAVAAADMTNPGEQTIIDLSATQRIDVGTDLAVNFEPTIGSTLVDFTATATSGAKLADLQALLGSSETLEGSWDFTVSGVSTGDETLLSFAVTGDPSADDLTVWYNFSTGWAEYGADDLLVGGGWASFTVDNFSSYAVSVVPEPATLGLLAFGGLVLSAGRRRRK